MTAFWRRVLLSLAIPSHIIASGQQADYCKISPAHTLCQFHGPSPSCGTIISSGFSIAEETLLVDLHNKLRSRVATSQEVRGRPGPQPAAADMLELSWDDELAEMAQRWAEQCVFGHDQGREVGRFKVGQNVYQTTRSADQQTTEMVREGVVGWFDEVKDFASSGVQFYQFDFETGHYTQMVWANTEKIGCGHISYQNGGLLKKYLVCNYGPTGNFIDSPMYSIGKACSKCPFGSSCSADNPGLCSHSNCVKSASSPQIPLSPETTIEGSAESQEPEVLANLKPIQHRPNRRPPGFSDMINSLMTFRPFRFQLFG